jgi:Carboxypeptidase regulatory-like domain
MRGVFRYVAAGALAVLLFPALCFAQFGAIAGVVRDSSGAVLPGVTVEAASPALIEKTRTAVTDAAGQFKVEQLRPGVYSVTFTLTSFSTVRREGIEISSGFTAPVNASLKVGAVSETITVSGEAPVVNVQSASEQKTLGKAALDALPTARSFATLGTALPGVAANQRDVGGTQGERGNMLSAHGGSTLDMTLNIDGMPIANSSPAFGQAATNFSLNDAAAGEISFETSAVSVESSTGGVRVNVIPQEGGNRFSGSLFGNFAKRGMSLNNYTDALKAQGLAAPTGYDTLWDESGGLGGPIRRDRLWFFAAHRYRGNDVLGTSAYYAKDPNAVVYAPDTSRPVNQGGWDLDNQIRITGQVSPRNKVSGFFDKISKCNCPTIAAGPTTVGQSALQLEYPPTFMTSGRWQAIISPKLLWDSALTFDRQQYAFVPQPDANITLTSPISVFDLSDRRTLRAPFTAGFGVSAEDLRQYNARGTLSYVTGSHAAKVGFTMHWGHRSDVITVYSDATQYTMFNGTPQSVTLSTAPYTELADINSDMGIFASDRWTLRQLTVTAAVRFDYVNISIPAETAPAGRWIGARSFAETPDVPNWKDISPRLGVSYDLFGKGKTAIKASLSRYVSQTVFGFPSNIDPFAATQNTMTRNWNDANGNKIAEGDPLSTDPVLQGEFFGPVNPNFGKTNITTHYDPALSQGWGKRPYNWEYSVGVQHELLRRVSLDVGYYHRSFGNQTVTDNLLVTPSDYNTFCITAPTDARLGSVSASQVCGLYDITLAKAVATGNNLITFASNYPGETSQKYNGFDLTVNARPSGRLFFQAGFSTGKTETKNCALVDNPQTLRFCDVAPPFLTQYRVSGGYTFPWQIQLSGVFQSIPPDSVTGIATYPARNVDAAASLGRTIATPGGVINVPLIDPSTYPDFGSRVNQVDLRLTKAVRIGRYRLEAIADFYNAFNTNTVLTYGTSFGPTWLVPSSILQSAFLKLGGRFTF